MKLILCPVIAILLYANASYSQTAKDSAIDMLNKKIVLFILSPQEHNFLKNYNNQGNKNITEFEKIKISIPQNNTEALNVAVALNEIKSDKSISLVDLQTNLIKKIFQESQNTAIINFFTKRINDTAKSKDKVTSKSENFKNNLKKIEDELNSTFTGVKEGPNVKDSLTRKNDQKEVDDQKKDLEKHSAIIPAYQLILILTIPILLSVFLFFWFKKVITSFYKDSDNAKKTMENSFNSHISQYHKTDRPTTKSIDDSHIPDGLWDKVHELELKLESILRSNNGENGLNEPISQTHADYGVKYYFPTPNRSGEFDDSQKRESISKYSAYMFTMINKTKSLANFQIITSEEVIGYALESPPDYIDPVCDTNTAPAKGKKIKSVKPGIAELRVNVWVVSKRSYIEFE